MKYLALLLTNDSKRKLLRACPPKHARVFAHHVTCLFNPISFLPDKSDFLLPYMDLLEQKFNVIVHTEVFNNFGHAVKVYVPPAFKELNKSQNHHITISCQDMIYPVYSNKLIDDVAATYIDHVPFQLETFFKLL
jgi:hypothetical protein